MRRFVAAILTCASMSAQASSQTTDFTDLWWNPNENGWGMNVIQQKDTLFVTLFVYGSNGAATWYVAPAVVLQQSTQLPFRFTGTLYQTTGPYFGAGAFNPNNVSLTEVGTLSFSASQVASATLTYNVGSVVVNKGIQRQTWRIEDVSGSYVGASIGTWSGCSTGNGPYESAATFIVTHGGNNITIREFGQGYDCTYTGSYTQEGKLGTMTGSGSCSDLQGQQVGASEIQVNLSSFSARFFATVANCTFTGRIGGVRRN